MIAEQPAPADGIPLLNGYNERRKQVNIFQKTLLIAMIICLIGCASAIAQDTTEEKPDSLLGTVEALIKKGKFADAKSSLWTLIAGMPAVWKAVVESNDRVFVAYWDEEHFSACAARDSESKGNKNIKWVGPSYSKAYYLLAYMSIESGNTIEAKGYIDKALELEPDHPTLLNEKGLILQLMAAHEEAVRRFNAVINSTGCVTNYEKARALRGQGISLIDLGKLNEAEKALKESLRIAPDNRVALGELEYIRRIRAGAVPDAPIGISPGR